MKRFLPIPIAFLLVSCGILTVEEPKQPAPTTADVADIIEENKEDLNYIKDRTADDIELGHAVRQMIVKDDLPDDKVGALARDIVVKQKTTPVEARKHTGKQVKEPSTTAKLCLCVLLAIGACSLIQCLIHLFRRKKDGQSQKDCR